MPLLTRHHGRDWHERSPFLFWEFSHGFLGNRPFLDHFFDSNVWYRPLDVYLHFLRLVFALSHGALPNSNYQVVILEQTFGPSCTSWYWWACFLPGWQEGLMGHYHKRRHEISSMILQWLETLHGGRLYSQIWNHVPRFVNHRLRYICAIYSASFFKRHAPAHHQNIGVPLSLRNTNVESERNHHTEARNHKSLRKLLASKHATNYFLLFFVCIITKPIFFGINSSMTKINKK